MYSTVKVCKLEAQKKRGVFWSVEVAMNAEWEDVDLKDSAGIDALKRKAKSPAQPAQHGSYREADWPVQLDFSGGLAETQGDCEWE